MMDALLLKWREHFGPEGPEVMVRAPGRVNIIGEHTDYNEGWVLPGAMSRCMFVLISRNPDSGHHWFASDLDEVFTSPEDIREYGEYSWARYIQGAISLYSPAIGPLKLLIGGDLPVGAGISSSSALVCGVLYALQQLTGGTESREELAMLGSRVEREVIGLQGGIMDQYAIMLSRAGAVMMLDCRDRSYTYHPVALPGCRWLLINTRVKHSLIDSDYNRRANECQRAVSLLQSSFPQIHSLRDVTPDMLRAHPLPDPLQRRATFVLEENERVHAMVLAMRHNDPGRAGILLNASHAGLRDQYQVSCDELDFLVDKVIVHPNLHGARMMGGGFGGCILCLIQEEAASTFYPPVEASYLERFGFAPQLIEFELGPGVERLSV